MLSEQSCQVCARATSVRILIRSIAIGDQYVPDAVHDTQPREAGCMPGTRESVLSKFMIWVRDDPMRICWLAGMAGTGKTSIAVTLCRMLDNDRTVVLGGAFFCSRSAGSLPRTEVRRIIPTLAIYLASQSLEFAEALAAGIKAARDPRIAHKPVSVQIDPLIIQPISKLMKTRRPIVFVIDALDECSDGRELAELLTAITDFRSDAKIKFILTSRPEMHIRGTPIANPDHTTILQLHTINEEEVTVDIRRYITGTLNAAKSDTTWYTSSDIEVLARLSRGLFIFASTVLLYVQAREHVNGRKERLRKVTSTAGVESAATMSLDKIYEMIVLEAGRSDVVDADELLATQRVLACILATRSSLSVQALAEILAVDAGDVRGSLERLHSVVYMPADDIVAGVRALHASFGDYICSRAALHIRIAESLGDELLARGCLQVMTEKLHFNVSQTCSSHKSNPPTNSRAITLSLEYACLQWIYHVSSLQEVSELDRDIRDVFCARFLFWLEVMSVLGKVRRAAAMLAFAAVTVR